jgi:CubicO group peptidase (beta-lactamase class C family)
VTGQDRSHPFLPDPPPVVRISAVGSVLILSAACAPDPRIAAVESSLPAVSSDDSTIQLSLTEWMDTLGVPGVSIAVVDDYRIVWAKGYGTSSAGESGAPVTPNTLFQAASIAKPVTALALLHHVEHGAFDLDADIRSIIRSWSLPDGGPDSGRRITLRHLLSHTAGIRAGGFMGYERGTPIPSTLQILNGADPALNTAAVVESRPGERVAYSGLGYTMIELAMVERLGLPFDRIVEDAVFRPLRMRSSTFAQELPEHLERRVARGHFAAGNVLPGGWNVHPELAAAGLWTTPTELATLAIETADSWRGRSERVLTTETTRRMLSPHREQMGLGFVVRSGDSLGFFSHSGGNQGYRAHVEMIAGVGKGVVVMTNSDVGHPLTSLITLAVAQHYGWPDTAQRRLSRAHVQLLTEQIAGVGAVRTRVPIDDTLLARYAGRYELAPGLHFVIAADTARSRLIVRLGEQSRVHAYPSSNKEFFFEAVDAQISFVADGVRRISALRLHQGGRTQEARRLPQ